MRIWGVTALMLFSTALHGLPANEARVTPPRREAFRIQLGGTGVASIAEKESLSGFGYGLSGGAFYGLADMPLFLGVDGIYLNGDNIRIPIRYGAGAIKGRTDITIVMKQMVCALPGFMLKRQREARIQPYFGMSAGLCWTKMTTPESNPVVRTEASYQEFVAFGKVGSDFVIGDTMAISTEFIRVGFIKESFLFSPSITLTFSF